MHQWPQQVYMPGEGQLATGFTCFLFGGPGTWKTTWAANAPAPLFLTCSIDGGDDAIISASTLPEPFGPPQRAPVWPIKSVEDMRTAVNWVAVNYERFGIRTVVVDSITFYADLWIAEKLQQLEKSGRRPVQMSPKEWGEMSTHLLKTIAQALHNTKLNVIWIALQKPKVTRDSDGNSRTIGIDPFIQGETSLKLPAMCKMIIHADQETYIDNANPGQYSVKPIYRTAPTHLTPNLRHKYAHAFPQGCLWDPQYGNWPTFRALMQSVGSLVYQ